MSSMIALYTAAGIFLWFSFNVIYVWKIWLNTRHIHVTKDES
jgi:hypothetical protein